MDHWSIGPLEHWTIVLLVLRIFDGKFMGKLRSNSTIISRKGRFMGRNIITDNEDDQCGYHGCRYEAEPNVKFCSRHGGASQAVADTKRRQMNYQLKMFQSELEAGVRKDNLHDLREEIVLARLMIERLMNQCTDELEFVSVIPAINPLVGNLERLITSSAKLEAFFGNFLTPEQVDNMVTNILDIIVEEVHDPSILERLANRIGEATTLVQGPQQVLT